VAESPDEVAAAVREWRVGVLSEAMRNRRGEPGLGSGGNDSPPTPIKGSSRRPQRVEGSRLPADERGR
jgi:hypothetical protein